MNRQVVYREDFSNNKEKYIDMCRIYLVKNKLETEEEIKEWDVEKIIKVAHTKHQIKLLESNEPLKLNKKCKNFCEGWYSSDSKCACGEKKVILKEVNLEYLNFTILDKEPSGKISCF